MQVWFWLAVGSVFISSVHNKRTAWAAAQTGPLWTLSARTNNNLRGPKHTEVIFCQPPPVTLHSELPRIHQPDDPAANCSADRSSRLFNETCWVLPFCCDMSWNNDRCNQSVYLSVNQSFPLLPLILCCDFDPSLTLKPANFTWCTSLSSSGSRRRGNSVWLLVQCSGWGGTGATWRQL